MQKKISEELQGDYKLVCEQNEKFRKILDEKDLKIKELEQKNMELHAWSEKWGKTAIERERFLRRTHEAPA